MHTNFSRRRLLIDGLRLGALVPSLGLVPRDTRREDRVLVVVQLTGGNDGLNTLVPHRQDGYYRQRPSLALKPSALHRLDDEHGLHPALGSLAEAYAEGELSVIRSVGYPHSSRSHFRSLEVWHSADPDHLPRGIGWLGRMADQLALRSSGALPALHIGDEALPLALLGARTRAPSIADAQGLCFAPLPGLSTGLDQPVRDARPESPELAFLQETARCARDASRRMEALTQGQETLDYPGTDFARKLRLIGQLIAGGFDTRIFFVTLDGFDTHARQLALHHARLEELAAALGAFRSDLARSKATTRVLTLVFSEFGRRVDENASRGTDHGEAGPVLLLGKGLRAGLLGAPLDLEELREDGLPFSTDFRALYTAIERDWMGLEPTTRVPALELFT